MLRNADRETIKKSNQIEINNYDEFVKIVENFLLKEDVGFVEICGISYELRNSGAVLLSIINSGTFNGYKFVINISEKDKTNCCLYLRHIIREYGFLECI